MEVKSDLKARGLYELRQIQELLTRWITTKDSSEPHDTRDQIRERINELDDLFNAIRQMSGDEEAQHMVNDFESLKNHSQKLMTSDETLSELVREDLQNCQTVEIEMFDGDDIGDPQIVRRRRKTVVNDFMSSLFLTIGICLFFAVVWTQYSKTH